ncbi:hypothetical protein CK203_093619 [Vitis vinifera]|uniref:Uncharacterized protein n=1 Tax=Vitis vinifera TaxID=29760 RepID=A0A438DJU8_VITVI|nr:hypothetical protein CK203_093619 [Vitis vinifera]
MGTRLAITGSREHYRFPGALPVLGSTPLDSTAPPPSPPPSGPTVQQDYTVHLRYHSQFSQPRGPVSIGLSRGSSLCMFLMESWVGTDMMTCQWQLCQLSSIGQGTNDHVIPSVFEWCRTALVCLIGHLSRHRTWVDLAQEFLRQYYFNTIVDALYGIEEGIARGLWADFSPSDLKGKNPGSGSRLSDQDQHKPVAPYRSAGPTYLHPAPQPVPKPFRLILDGSPTDSSITGRRVPSILLDNGSALNVQQHYGTQYDERHVLDAWLGIGSPPVGAVRVAFTVDHDIPYGLGYTPSEEDA